ncbi:hypothetical protein BDZ97DRAFT_1090597 [Flammula alnicola]|nr:hypothetical protein BDZ97DRAFT_1090597 [Flammula alnicola]
MFASLVVARRTQGDPVLMSLLEPLLSHNYHVLSYNSRGVGRSTGRSSFTGFNEVEDLKALTKWAVDSVSPSYSSLRKNITHIALLSPRPQGLAYIVQFIVIYQRVARTSEAS